MLIFFRVLSVKERFSSVTFAVNSLKLQETWKYITEFTRGRGLIPAGWLSVNISSRLRAIGLGMRGAVSGGNMLPDHRLSVRK